MSTKIEDAYVIGTENFNSWSKGFDTSGYLKVLPHPDLKVVFKDPFYDWQADRSGNYISSWGPQKDLNVTLKMETINQIMIDGFGILKSGDGVIPWLNNISTPYEQLRGYNGTIPGPMLITEPGDTLNIRLENALDNQVSNLHTHGLHVSPLGRGDNVLHAVNPGEDWDMKVDIPDNHFIGLDWYHPHLHGQTNEQVASGLAGQLLITTPHDLPDLNKFNPKERPLHFFAINTFGIQQVDRTGKPDDPLNQSTTTSLPAGTPLKVVGTEAEKPVYELSDSVYMGYNAKPIPYDPAQPTGNRAIGLFEYGGGPLAEPVENVIHTVNGQYNPTLDLKTGDWNVFSFTNMNSNAFHIIQLVKKVGDSLVPQEFSVVAIDGDVSGVVASKTKDVKESPVLNPGSRLGFQHWFEEPGTYYLLSNGTEEILDENDVPTLIEGLKGFNDGHLIWGPQVLATIEVTGDNVPEGDSPVPYDITIAQAEKVDEKVAAARAGDIDRERTFLWSANLGGAIARGNRPADTDVLSFEGAYLINGEFFSTSFTESMVPLTMPMLGTTEVWNMQNASGKIDPNLPPAINIPLLEWHPFHIHQNDFTVLEINGISTADMNGVYLDGVLSDTIALPPTYDPSKPPSRDNPYGTPMIDGETSEVKIVMKFEDFPGAYVNHCHILFHEDAGMMAAVRVILNTEDVWLGLGSQAGHVELRRASNTQQSVFLMPYGDSFQGDIKTAIGDINYKRKEPDNKHVTDNVTDIAVVQSSVAEGQNHLTVKVFDGQRLMDQQSVNIQMINGNDTTLLLREFTPFLNVPLSVNTKASIATGDINGDGFADVLVGISGDRSPDIEIYSGKDFSLLARVTPFTTNSQFHGAISIASGDVDGDNFDDVIVGGHGSVEVYSGKSIELQGSPDGRATAAKSSLLSEPLHPYGSDSHAEIEVTSGYVLQRPTGPSTSPSQTYHANITTLLKGDLPEGEQAVKIFTYTGGAHHGAHHGTEGSDHSDHSSDSDHSDHSDHSSDSDHSDHSDHSSGSDHSDHSSGGTLPADIRLDVAFTPGFKLDSLYGTFADLPDLPRGEPVLFALNASGGTDIIHLGAQNAHTSFPLTRGDHSHVEQHMHSHASDRSDAITQGGSLTLASTDADAIVCPDCNMLDELQTLAGDRVAIEAYPLDLGHVATVSHGHGHFEHGNFLPASNVFSPEEQQLELA